MMKKRKDLSGGQHRPGSGICFEPLEPRLLLSGDWAAGMVAAATDARALAGNDPGQDTVVTLHGRGVRETVASQQDRHISQGFDLLAQAPALNLMDSGASGPQTGINPSAGEPLSTTTIAFPRELVFVDGGIRNHDQLVNDLPGNGGTDRAFEIIILDIDRDGMTQISEALYGRQDLTAVHFVTHGRDGAIQLGATLLDSENIKEYSGEVSGWQNALAPEADLLFYGCELAAGHDGRMLLNTLGKMTGADVAASDDLTGDARMGGDWELEYESGDIETAAVLKPPARKQWSGVLATFNVDTTADSVDANPGDGLARDASGNTSLRAAIMEANALAGADTINLTAGTYFLSPGAAGENFAASGDLDITSEMTINGADADTTIIDAGDMDRVLHLTHLSANLNLSDVTIQNGSVSGKGGGIFVDHNLSRLDASRVVVTGNMADDGAGIFNDGTMTLTDVVISNNGNSGTAEGGGLHNKENAALNRVTISGNQADFGGGIHNDNAVGSLSLTNVTVSGNTAFTDGGGLHTQTAVSVLNSTFTLNSADNGGGIFNKDGSVNLRNTIVVGNSALANPDVAGTFNSLGHNLIRNTTGATGFVAGDIIGQPALLDPLADNGGFGQTHALQAGSPAINPAGSTGAPGIDQRGLARDGTPDIGAYELNGAGNIAGVVTIDNTGPSQGDTLTASVGDTDGAGGAVAYQWYRNGVAIAGATSVSYTTMQADVGAVITVAATYTDDLGSGESPISAGTAPVAHVNDPPIIGVNNGAGVTEGLSGTVITSTMLKADDPDDNAAGLIYTITAVSANGILRLDGVALGLGDTFTQDDIDHNRVTYDHNGSETVSDSFGFSVADGGEDGAMAAAGTFRISVTPVNDNDPAASNDAISLKQGTTTTTLSGGATSVLANDTDRDMPNDGLTVVLDSGPVHGRLTLNPDGTFSYTHDGSRNYTDSFTYTVTDDNGGVTATGMVTITVIPPAGNPPPNPPPSDGDTEGPSPDPEIEEPPAEPEGPPVTDSPQTVAPPAKSAVGEKLGSASPKKGGGRLTVPAQVASSQSQVQAARETVAAVDQRLSYYGSTADAGRQLADRQARLANLMSVRAYLNMTNALDDLREEVDVDNQVFKAYLGPAIASTVGLSVGYVVWLLRGGMLLTSLLSSLPAWQIIDPLPILAGKKGDGESEDDETLSSMVERKPRDEEKEKKSKGRSSRSGGGVKHSWAG